MADCRRFNTLVLLLTFVVASAVLSVQPVIAADEPTLSKEEMTQFLLTAKIVGDKSPKKGTSDTHRLTLSDGKLTHDASFQSLDEHKPEMRFANGQVEYNFVDSYKYNIAGYRVAELLGLDDMVPVYVERKWDGRPGSLSWWLAVQMDDADRVKKKIQPPDNDAWNKQMFKMRVLDQLVYDTDANLTNILITADWKVWRIDFSRAFRLKTELQAPKDLMRCDRQLLAKLKALNGDELAAKTKGFLTPSEVRAVMARRDKIVEHFQTLIAKQGEDAILY